MSSSSLWSSLFLLTSMASGAVVEYTFDIVPSLHANPDCFLRRQNLLVNNMFPGPIVRANLGDTIRVTINNHSPSESVSMHWHGLHMTGTPYADGAGTVTQCPLGPLQSSMQEFVADVPGTHYWHGHTSMSRMDGLQGFILIDNPDSAREKKLAKRYDEELLLFLQDYYHKTGPELRTGLDSSPFIWVGNAQSMLLNGKGPYSGCDPALENCDADCVEEGFASFDLEPTKTYRLRIVNAAGLVAVNFAISNHKMEIVEADGTLVKRVKVDSLDLTPGQRYSVLLKANAEVGTYWARTIIRHRNAGPTGYAYFKYLGAEESERGVLPTEDQLPSKQPEAGDLTAGPALDAKLKSKGKGKRAAKLGLFDETVDREFFWIQNQGFTEDTNLIRRGVNNMTQLFTATPLIKMARDLAMERGGEWPTDLTGTAMEEIPALPPFVWNYTGMLLTDEGAPGTILKKSSVPVLSLQTGETVQIVLQNSRDLTQASSMHPWHLHGHSFYIVGQGAGNYNPETDPASFNLENPVLRDTLTVWPFGWTAFRFIANQPGAWGFHCHLTPHAAMGMGLTIVVSPHELPEPPEGVTSCLATSLA